MSLHLLYDLFTTFDVFPNSTISFSICLITAVLHPKYRYFGYFFLLQQVLKQSLIPSTFFLAFSNLVKLLFLNFQPLQKVFFKFFVRKYRLFTSYYVSWPFCNCYDIRNCAVKFLGSLAGANTIKIHQP